MFRQSGLILSVVLAASLSAIAQNTSITASTNPPPAELAIDQIKKTVVFLQTSWLDLPPLSASGAPNARPRFQQSVGTGFLIFVAIPELGKAPSGLDRGVDFLVTAKHMIQQETTDHQAGPYALKTTIRYNTLATVPGTDRHWDSFDAQILDQRGDLAWFVDDLDPIADVALTPIQLDQNAEFKTVGEESFAKKSVLTAQHVNENDELLFAGLFTGYFGALKNYPIVRHGRLALMPGEDIAFECTKPDKKSQIYLAEVMSFGGNSGSPVFLRLGGIREGIGNNFVSGYSYFLLGLMKGFVSDEEAKQNTGIAMVVPVDKINEVLAGDRVKAYFDSVVANDKTATGDLKSAEEKFREGIAILEKQATDGSQLVATLRGYAAMLQKANRSEDARSVLQKADKIASQPVAKIPQP